nr:septal ring lytic transglycosylase RlpA family protein [uncultured Albidiferax sp.]
MFEKSLVALALLMGVLVCGQESVQAQTNAPEETDGEAAPAEAIRSSPADFWATDLGAGSGQRGKASWYGPRFHGKRTASGEVFKMHELTAAHRTLPLLSYAKVTYLRTGKSVIVRINDRGPHILTHRIIDLSRAAAAELGLLDQGTGDVLVERVVARQDDDVAPPRLRLPSLSNK